VQLIEAAKEGHLGTVRELIAVAVKVNCKDSASAASRGGRVVCLS